MSWGLGWKRPSEILHLTLRYGGSDSNADDPTEPNTPSSSATSSPISSDASAFRIDLEWSATDDEDQAALRLQSQLMVALPPPQDAVEVHMDGVDDDEAPVAVKMAVVKRREPLRSLIMWKPVGSGQQSDGVGVLTRLLRSGEGGGGLADHWSSVSVVSLCGCGLTVLPVEITRLPLVESLYLDHNRLSLLPPDLGELKSLKVLSVDHNTLMSVPVELRQCVGLVELSLEYNKLVRPLLDFSLLSGLWLSFAF